MSSPTPEPGAPGGAQQPGTSDAQPATEASGSQPLGANASMSDILARMQAMGAENAAAGREPAASASDAAGQPPEAGSPMPDAAGSGSSADAAGPVGFAYPPAVAAPPRKPRARLFAAIGGILAVVVGLGGKILLGLAVAGVGSQVLGSLFGGPFEKLPQSTKDGFEQRLNTALGPDADKLSEKDYADKYNAYLVDGLSRLGDDKLVSEVNVLTVMFDRADTATCAEAARSEWGTTGSTFEVSDKMWALLSQDELVGHIETQVEAVEASAAKAPPQVTVSADQARTPVESVFAAIGDTNNAVLDDLAAGTTRTDAEACGAVKAFHDAELALPGDQLAVVARFTASP